MGSIGVFISKFFPSNIVSQQSEFLLWSRCRRYAFDIDGSQ